LSEKRKRTLGTPFHTHKCASKLELTGEMFEVFNSIHLTRDTVWKLRVTYSRKFITTISFDIEGSDQWTALLDYL